MSRIISDGTSQPDMKLCEAENFDRNKIIRISYENEEQKLKLLGTLVKLGVRVKDARYGW